MQKRIKTIIIWNQIEKQEELKSVLLNRIILPVLIKKKICIDNPELKIISSPYIFFDSEFNISKEVKISNFDYIFVLAELQWFGNYYTSFYGYEILKQIREEKIRSAIFVLSALSINELNTQHSNLYEIFNTTGHYFVQIKNDGIEINADREIHPLSIEGLSDISEYLFTKSGYISENLHRLKNLMLRTKNLAGNIPLITEITKPYIKNIQQLLETEYHQDFMNLQQTLIDNLNQGYSLSESIEIFKNHIFNLIKTPVAIPNLPVPEIKPWIILYVDDEDHIRKLVQRKISEYGISCITAGTSNDALKILSDDLKMDNKDANRKFPVNSITIIITDIRLIKPSGVWDDLQGYDLCEKIYIESSNHLSFFLLTHKEGFIKKIAANNKGAMKIAFSKEVLNNDHTFRIFMNKVVDEGERVWNEILSRPKSTYWYLPYISKSEAKFAHGLGHYYRHYRLSRNYDQVEKKISCTAGSYVREVMEMRSTNEMVEMQRKFEFRSNLKDLVKDEPDKIMEKFYQKLIGRRIVIALWLFNLKNLKKTNLKEPDNVLINGQPWTMDEIAFLLGKGYLPFDIYDELGHRANSVLENLIKSLINTHFALPKHLEKDIPTNLLIEEQIWLREHFDFKI